MSDVTSNNRRQQFSLRAVLILTGVLAAYFAAVRGMTSNPREMVWTLILLVPMLVAVSTVVVRAHAAGARPLATVLISFALGWAIALGIARYAPQVVFSRPDSLVPVAWYAIVTSFFGSILGALLMPLVHLAVYFLAPLYRSAVEAMRNAEQPASSEATDRAE